jgi:hypothetical protein
MTGSRAFNFTPFADGDERATQARSIERRDAAVAKGRRSVAIYALALTTIVAVWLPFMLVTGGGSAVLSLLALLTTVMLVWASRQLQYAEAERESYVTHLAHAGIIERARS